MKQLVITERENIVAIADAVRANSDITSEISLDGIASGINYVANYVAANAGGVDTSDATATAGDILQGETAYADGQKITGTFTLDNELTTQDNLIAQIQTALEGKAAGGSAEPVLQDKSVTPSTTTQTVTPDSGYDGLSKVTVNAMPTATQATPSITVNSSGLITATATQTAGYVAAGTKSGTKQLTTQAAKTITPSTSSQTAVAKNVYTTGAITVGAIPSTYVKPTTTKAATTYTPTTSNQTIAAGTYCSGAQTIKGDANLKAENIAEGVSIFGVTGTHSGGGSSGDSSIETCTFTFTGGSSNYYPKYISYMTINESGVITTIEETCSSSSVTVNCLCDSIVVVQTNGGTLFSAAAGCKLLYTQSSLAVFHIVAGNGQNASARAGMGGGGVD